MPHVIVKLWPGKTEAQKKRLAEKIAQDVMDRVAPLLGARRKCTTSSRPLPGASAALDLNNVTELASRAQEEQCVHLADFMLRRTTLGFARDQGRSVAALAASLLAAMLSSSKAKTSAKHHCL